jgi:sigma-54 dependent transcriptional regulator of gfr operon
MLNPTKTKQLILEYIEMQSAQLTDEKVSMIGKDKFSAQAVAKELGISRNLASQYLNEWEQKGVLSKTSSRPVYFFSQNRLEQNNENRHPQDDHNIDELIQSAIEDNIKEDMFQTVIGYSGSIRNVIDQCKAAIKYPPNGLPILLTGASGSGKSYLAQLMYQYAVQENLIAAEKQFVIMNCSEFANNPELLTANLFGYKKGAFTGADSDHIGLIQVADGGVLFLDEVHSLNPSCQEKLFLFMDKGVYHLVGDNKNWKSSSAKLIFATTKDPEQALLRTLLRRIPVLVNVPSLEDRPVEEKEQLLFSFIQQEAKSIGKKIMISQSYFQTLMSYKFLGNIGELKNAIRRSCANAFLYQEQDSESLTLKMYHLPENIISYSSIFMLTSKDEDDHQLLDPTKKKVEEGAERIVALFDELLQANDLYMDYKIDNKLFMENTHKIITKYYDYLIFEKKVNTRLDAYEASIQRISEHICERYKIQLLTNGLIPLVRYLLERGSYQSQIILWENQQKDRTYSFYNMLKKQYPYEFSIAEEFSEKIEMYFDMHVSEMNRAILLLNIKFFNPEINVHKVMGIVLSHGYSTASSIVDAVNKLVDDYIFEAIDMPLDVSVFEIGERLQRLVKRRHLSQDLILLVDMGSLEEIYKEISVIPNLNIGIINNITTKMALEVATKIKNNMPMIEILQTASENNHSTYKIIENRIREKAILFVSETGTEVARNMSELFFNSLPRSMEVKIIAYDYYKLLKNGMNDEVFSKYEVILIAGTINPIISEIPYVAVEDIISGSQLEIIQQVLSSVFTIDEMQLLQNSMLMNFSLQNVVGYLTILNADKVLSLANEALNKLQDRLQIQLKSKYIIGLNVHLSCLVERLVKKIPIETYYELEIFEKNQIRFIQACKDSFHNIEKHYGVKIPISEIAYIYDYFQKEMDHT